MKRRQFITLLSGAAPAFILLPSNSLFRSLDPEIQRRRFPAVLCDLVLDSLPFVERTQAGTLDRRDMNKHVPAATTLRLNETIALSWIEPLHRTARHCRSPNW